MFGLVALIALGAVVAPSLRAAFSVVPLLKHPRWPWFFAALVCQMLMYLCVAEILAQSLAAFRKPVSLKSLYLPAVVFLFANRAVPGPAIAGLASLVYLLGRRTIPPTDAQVTAGCFYLADYVSFSGVIVFAGIFVIASNSEKTGSAWPYLLACGIIFLLGIVTIIAYGHAETLIKGCVGVIRRLETMARPKSGGAFSITVNGLLGDLYHQSQALIRDPAVLASLVGTGLLMHTLETLTLICAARGFDARLSFGAAASSYAAGNLAAIVSFLPGGVGLYEGAMVSVLHTLGHVSLPVAGATTIVYRLLSLAFPFPFALNVIRHALARPKP